MMLLEDTELSCVAGLPHEEEGGELSGCFRLSCALLLHKYEGLLKVTVLCVNSCSELQLYPAASSASSSGVFCSIRDPRQHVEMVSSEKAAWQLPCFPCLAGTLPAWVESGQLSFLFCNGRAEPKITTHQGHLGRELRSLSQKRTIKQMRLTLGRQNTLLNTKMLSNHF